MKQLTLAIAPPPEPVFDSFVPGANQAAWSHLRDMALPGTPLYLWGPSGSGKTHLLKALAARVQAEGQQAGWFDAATPLPWALQPAWALVVVDDAQALGAEHQHAAFSLFVEAGSQGVQWAAAGNAPPVDLPLRDDLRSRLGWGHVFALKPLDEQHSRAALRREADRRGIWLSDEVMGYLLTRFERDLKHLMALLGRLDGFALAEHRAVTVPLLKKMLAEEQAA